MISEEDKVFYTSIYTVRSVMTGRPIEYEAEFVASIGLWSRDDIISYGGRIWLSTHAALEANNKR